MAPAWKSGKATWSGKDQDIQTGTKKVLRYSKNCRIWRCQNPCFCFPIVWCFLLTNLDIYCTNTKLIKQTFIFLWVTGTKKSCLKLGKKSQSVIDIKPKRFIIATKWHLSTTFLEMKLLNSLPYHQVNTRWWQSIFFISDTMSVDTKWLHQSPRQRSNIY